MFATEKEALTTYLLLHADASMHLTMFIGPKMTPAQGICRASGSHAAQCLV
jgi:hypothetical protein